MLWWTLRKLKSKNLLIICEAIRKLGDSRDPRAFPHLATSLRKKDERTRCAAAEALGAFGDTRATEPLVAALRDERWSVRLAAAEALGSIGDGRAVEPLVAALRDQESYVRSAAAQALGKIGDAALGPLLAVLGGEEWDVRKAAAEALGEIGDARAVEPLLAALRDKNWQEREAAAQALGKIGDARAVKPLVAALRDDDSSVRHAAAEALEKIKGERAVERLKGQGEEAIEQQRQVARTAEPLERLGILFDIGELGGGLYGYAAYRILFEAIDTRQIPGCSLSDGDTNATLAGRANQYCIAIEAVDSSNLTAVRNALSTCNAKGLLPPASRFLYDEQVCREPLVLAARINAAGELVDCKTGWVIQARKESREKH